MPANRTPTEKDCGHCDRGFVPTAPRQTFCSPACRDRADALRRRIRASEPARGSEEYEAELRASIRRLREAWRCR